MQIPGQSLQASSIQRIQAQQAFKTKKAEKKELPSQAPEIQVSNKPLNSVLPKQIFTPKRIQEIKQIAQQAGFVGLEETDIERAYATGQSLLTDYRA